MTWVFLKGLESNIQNSFDPTECRFRNYLSIHIVVGAKNSSYDKYILNKYHHCYKNMIVFTAILWVFLFILLLYIIIKLLERGKRYFMRRQACTTSTCQLDIDAVSSTGAAAATTQTAAVAMMAQKKISNRLCSLDAFRGLAIVTMVFTNTGCGKYYWIDHATWNGIHPADFIFPSFLWIMGVCIPFTLKSQFDKNIPRQDILGNILIVSCSIFFLSIIFHFNFINIFCCCCC